MAGAINLTEVDFEQIRQNLISYLKSTDKFTDYDFDGSNLNVILSLISYQAQMNSYNVNMVANESFLSTSSIRKNTVSNARMIGYTPISTTSSVTFLDFEVDLRGSGDLDNIYPGGLPQYLEIRPGNFFGANSGKTSYKFNVIDTQAASLNEEGVASFGNVPLYEGTYMTKKFVQDDTDYNQRFIIPNPRVDITTLRVVVQEDPNVNTSVFFNQANNLVELTPESKSYWVEEVEENQYELTFGDGLFGQKLNDGAVITVNYVVASGSEANGLKGASSFAFLGKIFDYFGGQVTKKPVVTSASTSEGGTELESISSIKFRAPKSYSAQKRCVTSSDYDAIIRDIYPAVEDVYVYGGEELEIPEYGRVYIVIKPNSGDFVSNATKKLIKDRLEDYRVASIDLILQDPDVLYIETESTVYYDEQVTMKDTSAIVADVRTALSEFAGSPIVSRFGGTVRYSRIVGTIDDADNSINRNITALRMRKNMGIAQNTLASYEICFENQIDRDRTGFSVYSTGFRFTDNEEIYYFEDDPQNRGSIRLFHFDIYNEKIVDNKNFGTVDYIKGEVMLGENNPFSIASTIVDNSIVEVRGYPVDVGQEIVATKSVYLKFDVAKSDIGAIVETGTTGS
jgi:hypothetical protein